MAVNETLARFNVAAPDDARTMLDGLYEPAPWIVESVLARRPFASVAALKLAMARAVREAGREAQLALIRAYPEPTGLATGADASDSDSTEERSRAGLAHCSADEWASLQRLDAAYRERFGWPFILAVGGPRGRGLTAGAIRATFERRLGSHPDTEFAECLRQIDRIAELRIDQRFDAVPARGNAVWDMACELAQFSDPGFGERGQLTVTYLGDAHRACARMLEAWMREAGFDEVGLDAVGNVVGVYFGNGDDAPDGTGDGGDRTVKRLLTGSHYDTVRNAGRFDGRLGILTPMACVASLHRAQRRLPFGIEVIAFAEEEGQRYKATFLGSRAVTGRFDFAWLDQADADGVTMRDAMQRAGLPATRESIAALARDPSRYLGFVEVHIEQGPVLDGLGLPLGIVTSINGGVRYLCEVIGIASHAGTTPMNARRDAVNAVAELALYLERRAASVPQLVGTIGMLSVPGGSTNVVPGRCQFSLDIRATTDAVRDACVRDVLDQLAAVCTRRGLTCLAEETMRVPACASAPAWQARWEAAVQSLGLPVHRMPSGAGHDAMKLHETMPQAMLFVRGENGGISHNPLESSTADDIQLAIEAFDAMLELLARDHSAERLS